MSKIDSKSRENFEPENRFSPEDLADKLRDSFMELFEGGVALLAGAIASLVIISFLNGAEVKEIDIPSDGDLPVSSSQSEEVSMSDSAIVDRDVPEIGTLMFSTNLYVYYDGELIAEVLYLNISDDDMELERCKRNLKAKIAEKYADLEGFDEDKIQISEAMEL